MENESKRHFTSRIIDDLDNSIRLSTLSSERNVLFAKKAFALARHSLLAEARKLILDLRQVNQDYEPRLSAWIMFAEGIIEHSEGFDLVKSQDRIYRAHLVGQAANDPSLAATSAAWLAHFRFTQGKYLESTDFLIKAFSWSIEADSEARSRASMVLGAGFYFAGELTKAKAWFIAARAHAVRSGDIAMQNIILFNSSALHVAQLNLLDCISVVDPAELNFAVMSTQSVENLNTALGISNQPTLIPVQRAELLTIQRKWQAAIDIFDVNIDSAMDQGQSNWAPKFLAQRAWCKANLRDDAGSRSDIEAALSGIGKYTDPDDLSILHLRIASSARLMGESALADQHQSFGLDFLAQHKDHQELVKKHFDEAVNKLQQG